MTNRRLLVIDDETDFGAFVGRVGSGLGFAVEVTTRAADFQEAYLRFEPTHIILDIVMPERDGIELVGWLAAMGFTGRIIIITGFHPRYAAAAETLGRVQGLRPIVTLKKPVALAELRTALDGPMPVLLKDEKARRGEAS
jgi:DNA-binding response OmpR family regulator